MRRILLAVVLLVCLAVVWCRKSPDNAGKIGERNGDATMAMDENSTSKLCTKLTSAANVVVTRPPQTIKPAWDVRSVPQSLPLSAASAISKFAERQTNSSIAAAQYASDMNDVMDEMLNRGEIPGCNLAGVMTAETGGMWYNTAQRHFCGGPQNANQAD